MLPSYWSRSNPVDLVGDRDPSIPIKILEALLQWDGCDAVINLGILGRRIVVRRFGESVLKADPDYSVETVNMINRQFDEFEHDYLRHIADLMDRHQKPIFGVSLLPDEKNQTIYRVNEGGFKGVFYPTPERAVKAFAKMVEYHRFLKRN